MRRVKAGLVSGSSSKEVRERKAAPCKDTRWKPGQSGNPRGQKVGWQPFYVQFREAVERLHREKNIDLFELFIKQAQKNPVVLCNAMNKMVANKIQIGMGPEDVQQVVSALISVVTKHIADEKVLLNIAAEMEEVAKKWV